MMDSIGCALWQPEDRQTSTVCQLLNVYTHIDWRLVINFNSVQQDSTRKIVCLFSLEICLFSYCFVNWLHWCCWDCQFELMWNRIKMTELLQWCFQVHIQYKKCTPNKSEYEYKSAAAATTTWDCVSCTCRCQIIIIIIPSRWGDSCWRPGQSSML